MKRMICAAALTAVSAAAQEMQWFVGTWTCKGQQTASPMGPAMETGEKIEFRMKLGGSWLQYKGTAISGPLKGKEVFDGFSSWDGTVHQRYDFGIGGMAHFTTKGWEGDKIVFSGEMTMGGQKIQAQETIAKTGETSFTTHLETADKDGKMAVLLEETCSKK